MRNINIDVLTREDVIEIIKQETAHLKKMLMKKYLQKNKLVRFYK